MSSEYVSVKFDNYDHRKIGFELIAHINNGCKDEEFHRSTDRNNNFQMD
jgi:hypothetical protein